MNPYNQADICLSFGGGNDVLTTRWFYLSSNKNLSYPLCHPSSEFPFYIYSALFCI